MPTEPVGQQPAQPGPTAAAPPPSSFEEALAALTEVVGQLERGELTLDQALALFETGVGLARVCRQRLDEAEGKIELLLEQHGSVLRVAADETTLG